MLDFSWLSLKSKAFSGRPMQLMEPEARDHLASVMEICAIETASESATSEWQNAQIRNLLAHARLRSRFWRARIGPRAARNGLSFLPVQTRKDVIQQVTTEGSLLGPSDQIDTELHWSSGSSGTPVRFYVSSFNVHFNGLRSVAQYLLEGRDINCNRTQLVFIPRESETGFSVVREGGWIGSFGNFLESGANKKIRYIKPNWEYLERELISEPIGYLVSMPWIIELMLDQVGTRFLKLGDTKMYIPVASSPSEALREKLSGIGIPVRANYSAEEVGLIAAECSKCPGFFHVARSNVVVEIEPLQGYPNACEGKTGKVLITHLHSYATPFIRYDVGDIATLYNHCKCGHAGPTLSQINGRSKALLKHPDGRYSVFHLRGGQLAEAVQFDEYRIRQISTTKIIVEIARENDLTPDECEKIKSILRRFSGEEFNIQVDAVRKIDWGESKKRLGFHNELIS